MRIGKIHPVVVDILQRNPLTRGSDDLLYIEVVRELADPHILSMSFEKVFQYRARLGLPSMETVMRTRRKAQERDESLKPSENIIEKRFENWKDVREYVSE